MRDFFRSQFNLVEGVVKDSNDPQQMGRLKVWCPSIDGDTYNLDDLPWALYVSPLAGQVENYPAGSSGAVTGGLHSYGFWAIPKEGATVLVALLYGDVNRRCYIGSMFDTHANRSLPVGRNRPDYGPAPVSDTFDPVEPQTNNLNDHFSGQLDSSQAKTRGAYERAVAQDKDTKDGTEGYQKSVFDKSLDPQTYCLSTPGRHSIIFQDNPSNARVRFKTAEGNQIIMDDANERIYVSTAKGNSWFEMDKDGHVHVYGAASMSFSAGVDFNVIANKNITFSAGGDVNIQSKGHTRISACDDVSISGKVVNIQSQGIINVLAAANIIMTGSQIHLNGPKAAEAPCAGDPSVVPNHEPWDRPPTTGTRGKNWKA